MQDIQNILTKGMTLAERSMLLNHNCELSLEDNLNNNSHLLTHKNYVSAIRQQHPFDIDEVFEIYLINQNINRSLFGSYTKFAALDINQQPNWLRNTISRYGCEKKPIEDNEQRDIFDSFLAPFEPILDEEWLIVEKEVLKKYQDRRNIPFSNEAVITLFYSNLSQEIFEIAQKTMLLEFNIAKINNDYFDENDEVAITQFGQLGLSTDYRHYLIAEYPTLFRVISDRCECWRKMTIELFSRLIDDWDILQRTFNFQNEKIKNIEIGVGDTHGGARSVAIITLDGGLKFVYKPRPVSIEKHFYQFLEWINDKGNTPKLPSLTIVDKGTHGWVEFIQSDTCKSKEQLHRFYQRQGVLLATLHLLRGGDVFRENIIACGEYPYIIDSEVMFQPVISEDNSRFGQFQDSVMGTGMLPQATPASNSNATVDISGLGSAELPEALDNSLNIQKGANGGFELKTLTGYMVESKNRATLNGKDVHLENYIDDILSGFKQTYHLFVNNKTLLKSENGLLSLFANDRTRVVLRPTRTYHRLLKESYHPDLFRDAVYRELFLDKLWIETLNRQELLDVVVNEKLQMSLCDIPYYTSKISENHIYSSTKKVSSNFFAVSGFDAVIDRLENLSSRDQYRQEWFIKNSLLSQAGDIDNRVEYNQLHAEEVTKTDFLNAAIDVAEKLNSITYSDTDSLWWYTYTSTGKSIALQTCDIDLYDGISGIAVFYAQLYRLTKEEKYYLWAQEATQYVVTNADEYVQRIKKIGAYSGISGLVYALAQISLALESTALLDNAIAICEKIPGLVDDDEDFDILSGSAGAIAVLYRLYKLTNNKKLLDIMGLCGDHLLKHAHRSSDGWYWKNGDLKVGLTGFSHGAAGIAWALDKLASLTDRKCYSEAADNAISFERALFSEKYDNWLDLRPHLFDPTLPHSELDCCTLWCHGAPGIGLARIDSPNRHRDKRTQTEIEIALNTTLEKGFGLSHCLCHGDFGNWETLNATLNFDSELISKEELISASNSIYHHYMTHGTITGSPNGIEVPGLMLGLAGIGYGLLRMADPDQVPSVLLLEIE